MSRFRHQLAPNRRGFLTGMGVAFFGIRGLMAEELDRATGRIATPEMTEGPYYPDKMPLDTDNDLLIINDAITPAVGEISWVSGCVMDASGQPLRNATVEIWQCDAKSSYIHSRGRNENGLDGNFQGYGRYQTDSTGRYQFRTIKPVSYDLNGMFRAPHIHFAISRNGRRIFTTQMMVKGHADNARDHVLGEIADAKARDTILVDFLPIPGSKLGELTAKFDLIIGRTLEEGDDHKLLGGIGKAEARRFGGPPGRGRLRPGGGAGGPPPPPRGGPPPEPRAQ
ncbi:protocatechuate 3,4-dioxygenase [Luteolibacter sp. GHJ8]|uniref:Protocatechuate 3,4-dioxygenase n=1 Tax=Luteolibacter rhizosphaerae TaxID=2989719 RepID=A0ABT3G7E4_9BACT|nr:protocatechuate 3,4-dioxygenase [Luteolibacter rhizosphaerae]MCW1915760.1 protocatechuate 3,4-dioxygenase [Luteolibacter rhizosphaerae]